MEVKMENEELETDAVSKEINKPLDVENEFDNLGDDDYDDTEDLEDDEFDEETEDELFKENPLKAIWLKLKELSE